MTEEFLQEVYEIWLSEAIKLLAFMEKCSVSPTGL